MVFSEIYGTDFASEIRFLIQNDSTLGTRLSNLLEEVAIANESIDSVNLFVLKYIYGEVSKEDLLIAINKYKASKQPIMD